MRLRYIGPNATTFLDFGELEPGQEFDVDGELAERMLNHGHIEQVDPPKAGKKTEGKPAKAEPGGGEPNAGTS